MITYPILIFFNGNVTEWYIKTLNEKSEKLTIKEKEVVNLHSEKILPNGNISKTLHMYKKDLGAKLTLSFIKETDYAKTYKLTGFAAELRNEKLREYKID